MSSACYVYAIVRRDTALPTRGTDSIDDDLSMVSWRELAAVTGRVENEVTQVTTDAVLHHETVIEAVRRYAPALPLRFGTVFRDRRSVAFALAEQYEALAADLQRLGDKMEMSLTALWVESHLTDEHPAATRKEVPPLRGAGARYLQERASQFRCDDALKDRARIIARKLDEVFGELTLAQRVSLVPTQRVAIRTAYLLNAGGVDAFAATLEETRRVTSDVRMLLTGPWPPYSFVGRAGSERVIMHGRFAELARLFADAKQERVG